MNRYLDDLTNDAEQELKDLIIEELENGYDGYVCDLHNRVFNEDYFIIGTYQAKTWLEDNYGVFKALEAIREYEQDNFGEVNTDFSSPEHVCNMLVYILGEEILSDLETVQEYWNDVMDDEIREKVLAELKDED